jgi:hypothetical protein
MDDSIDCSDTLTWHWDIKFLHFYPEVRALVDDDAGPALFRNVYRHPGSTAINFCAFGTTQKERAAFQA